MFVNANKSKEKILSIPSIFRTKCLSKYFILLKYYLVPYKICEKDSIILYKFHYVETYSKISTIYALSTLVSTKTKEIWRKFIWTYGFYYKVVVWLLANNIAGGIRCRECAESGAQNFIFPSGFRLVGLLEKIFVRCENRTAFPITGQVVSDIRFQPIYILYASKFILHEKVTRWNIVVAWHTIKFNGFYTNNFCFDKLRNFVGTCNFFKFQILSLYKYICIYIC